MCGLSKAFFGRTSKLRRPGPVLSFRIWALYRVACSGLFGLVDLGKPSGKRESIPQELIVLLFVKIDEEILMCVLAAATSGASTRRASSSSRTAPRTWCCAQARTCTAPSLDFPIFPQELQFSDILHLNNLPVSWKDPTFLSYNR